MLSTFSRIEEDTKKMLKEKCERKFENKLFKKDKSRKLKLEISKQRLKSIKQTEFRKTISFSSNYIFWSFFLENYHLSRPISLFPDHGNF